MNASPHDNRAGRVFGEPQGTKAVFKRLAKTSFAEDLAEALNEWAKKLPEEYRDFEPSYLTDVSFGEKANPRDDILRFNAALAEELASFLIPTTEAWYSALEERRKDAGALLRQNPQSLLAGRRNALYLAHTEDVANYLYEAAERLRSVCKKNRFSSAPRRIRLSRQRLKQLRKLMQHCKKCVADDPDCSG